VVARSTLGDRLDHNGPVRPDEQVRLTAVVHGDVQGVGFRWWTMRRANELGLAGQARNLPDGRVEVVAEGSRAACEQLLQLLRQGATPGYVDRVTEQWQEATGAFRGFMAR
jgi:acylphosphatase